MLTLIPESGAEQITTFHSAFRRLPPEVDVVPILAALGDGRTVPVTLTDGTRARLKLTATARQPELFEELPEPPALRQVYQAQCTSLLGLAMTVLCTATDKEQVKRMIAEVLRGERSPPPGFQIVLDAGDAEALIDRLRAMIAGDQVALTNVQDVLVTELAPTFDRVQQRLEYRP